MKLKDLLPIIFANKFIVRDSDKDMLVIWQGRKHDVGYDVLQHVYNNYEVSHIRTHKNGIVHIDIRKESWL